MYCKICGTFLSSTQGYCMRVAAKGADLMICEGMYYELPKTGNAANNYHMTMIEAASLAASSGVKEMILTHFSPSIIDPTI